MLSPGRDDEDDDRHLCIRCKTTILGLDNYVKHRREICGKRKYDVMADGSSKTPLSSISIEPTYSLGADVFFQSLELQSSVKKKISRLTPPVSSAKTISNSHQKTNLNVVVSSSSDLPRMSPLVANLQGEDWIGGRSLQLGSSEDSQTRLINAIKDTPSTSYDLAYNYKDEESEEATEESEDDDEEEVPTTGGKWKPPPHHTGGKWRPASPDQDDWEIREEHTGAEWKSMIPVHDRDDDYDAPPPSHTKGKWIPGENEQKSQIMQNTIQTKGSVQYWCGVCNRRLASKAIYEKHLHSNMHMRKVLPENDLEFSGLLHQRNDREKRICRSSHYVDNTVYAQTKRKKQSYVAVEKNIKKKRNRKHVFVHCSGCKSRVRTHLMGKHLISHYHFRKTTNPSTKEYQQLILDNIEAIVHQSPFQCSPCKFYTNWLSTLMQHWFTEEHDEKMALIEGRYWCSFCKFECEISDDMIQHMSSPSHGEVVAVINRSMPIVIRKRTVFKCKICFKEFKYNIELKKHCERVGHDPPHTATDLYQELKNCHICLSKFKSSLTLAAHLKNKHRQNSFFCLTCSLTFETSKEAKSHRFTSEHRIRQKEKLRERGIQIKDLRKKCPYCVDRVILNNTIELKEHIIKVHPKIKKKCPKCGKAFVLSQEVTRHVRQNACKVEEDIDPDLLASRILWKCRQCAFKTDSQAECLFHEVLHSEPEMFPNAKNDKKMQAKYKCPVCSKSYAKSSLRFHMRQHTNERPLVCSICSASFTRQGALSSHIAKEHGITVNRKTKVKDEAEAVAEDNILAPETLESTANEILAEECSLLPVDVATSSRANNCPHSDCTFIANTPAQLAKHRKSHREKIKRHECNICDFRTDQSSHLKRHMICHAGIKPYACPHCLFTCGSLENLRKHVLHSGRHRGLALYHCPECAARADHAAALRRHLLDAHTQHYDAARAHHTVRHLLTWQPTTNDAETADTMDIK